MAERPRIENLEPETNPEIAVLESERITTNAVSAIEGRDAADPVISSGWMSKIKELHKNEESGVDAEKIVGVAGNLITLGFNLCAKMVWGLLKFAKKVIEKKGNITFKEGREIGEEIFNFDSKKDKK